MMKFLTIILLLQLAYFSVAKPCSKSCTIDMNVDGKKVCHRGDYCYDYDANTKTCNYNKATVYVPSDYPEDGESECCPWFQNLLAIYIPI